MNAKTRQVNWTLQDKFTREQTTATCYTSMQLYVANNSRRITLQCTSYLTTVTVLFHISLNWW